MGKGNDQISSGIGKLLLVGLLVAAGFFVGTKIPQRETVSQGESSQVLGKNIGGNSVVDTIGSGAQQTIDNGINAAQSAVSDTSKEVSNSISSIAATLATSVSNEAKKVVVQQTASQIMQQINKLPEQDRQIIKETVCK